ncbi:MAG: hypothetical protein IOC64_12365 [Methylobacterium sp.]|nr:hypothetical protein [Methylobacterium sp.]MCA3608291.1 hypothetical protein [Methylobacterium sp.]MCA3618191.1 hypothetical protein [Methylobacterium sp.]MCA3621710.1 hypothetical protein [Methylobacterium sp.]MCA3623117.1 hypothetical protein [Methylobacterium sp.]
MSLFAALPTDMRLTRTGLETLLAMIAGRLPGPRMAETLNFWLTEAEFGRLVVAGDPPEHAPGDARLVDFADKVYAHVSETCMIFPKEGPGA